MSGTGHQTGGLGGFLRAARARVDPARAGVVSAGPRRVPGLRREEVAVLAGVSANYYARLEQGRERHPSPQVLDALSRALDLGPDAHEHLHRLAGTVPGGHGHRQARVRPDVLALIEEWTSTPALVLSDTLDVLAQNRLARALHTGFARSANLAEMTFLDPAGSTFYVDWHRAAAATVASLRLAEGRRPHDQRLREVIAQLSAGSAAFRALWADQDVRGRTYEAKRFDHPVLGRIDMSYQAFDVRGCDGQQLLVYRAEDAEAVRLLAGLAV